ncbi:MAG: NUDIX hydrolase [Pseudomonadota bacterium]
MTSDNTRGPWRIHSTRTVYDNPWIRVMEHDVARPDGEPGLYGVVEFKNYAIGVLPIDAEGRTWLVGQHRFPRNVYSWELPEGGGPKTDDPLASAQRELKEETGLSAQSWFPFLRMDLSNSVTDERAFCFLAWDLHEGVATPDETEVLEARRRPFSEVFSMVMAGEIEDSLTVAMVLKARMMALSGALPDHICVKLTC